jgi:hypothetical protein
LRAKPSDTLRRSDFVLDDRFRYADCHWVFVTADAVGYRIYPQRALAHGFVPRWLRRHRGHRQKAIVDRYGF